MKIAMFAWEALEGLSIGGGAVYASRLAAAMAAAGHQVRLFTRLGDGQAMEEVVGSVHVRRCPWDRLPGFMEEIGALTGSFLHYFADDVRANGPFDVVHCHEWLTVGAGVRAAAFCGARLAVSFHSTEWARTGEWPDHGESARIAALEREGVERADAIFAASHWVKRKIMDQFHPPDWKCEVVYHGVDFPEPASSVAAAAEIRARAGLASGAPSLLFAGLFSHAGGGELAARACRLVAARFPAARFLFVGSGPLEEVMRREVGPAGIFFPPQGRLVPPGFYQAADLVLAPFRRERNGRAALPAWAAGNPVAVLRDSVASEFVMDGANGWVVPDDPEELAEVIAGAFADPDNTVWMGRNGRVAAETAFSWDAAAAKVLEAYARRDRLTPPPAQ